MKPGRRPQMPKALQGRYQTQFRTYPKWVNDAVRAAEPSLPEPPIVLLNRLQLTLPPLPSRPLRSLNPDVCKFFITLREGLEASCWSASASPTSSSWGEPLNKFVYLGWGWVCLPLVVAFLFQVVVSQFERALQPFTDGGDLIFATLVLTYMAVWMQKQAKSQVGP